MKIIINKRSIGAISFVLSLLVSCSAAPPSRYSTTHDPVLDRDNGTLLLVDVCVQKDGMGDAGDYFAIAESRHAAETLVSTLRSYLKDSSISIRADVSVVCAARHGDKKSIRASDRVGAPVRDLSQPLYAQAAIKKDSAYMDAISVVSSYAFERAAVDSSSGSDIKSPPNTSTLKFLQASDVIREHTQASSIFFLGVLGTSRTGAKAATEFLGSFLVGMATAVATAGLGTGYYVIFLPGQKGSGRFMEGALIDLESGNLTWSKAIKAGGNPVKPEIWDDVDLLDLLFHDLLFQRVPTQVTTPKQGRSHDQ